MTTERQWFGVHSLKLTSVDHFDRGGDLADAIRSKVAIVVERLERVTGYSTGIAFSGHSVGENNEDLQALISAAKFSMAAPAFSYRPVMAN